MRLREGTEGEGTYPETHTAVGEGTGGEFQIKERKAPGIRTKEVTYMQQMTRARYAGERVNSRTGKRVSLAVRRNRKKALRMSRGYVIFLAFISIMTVLMCVQYLKLKETITSQMNRNEKLESELVSLRSENDALLENINSSVDWNAIKDTAINKLGMKYAEEDQIVWYNTDGRSYIRQYQDVPS